MTGAARFAPTSPSRPATVRGSASWRASTRTLRHADLWLRRMAGQVVRLPRIYYGAIGRGLFQTVYPAGVEQPLIHLPLSVVWIALAVLLILIGIADWPLLAIGAAGLALTAASAIFTLSRRRLERRRDNFRTRTTLAVLALIGPMARSYTRRRRSVADALSRRGMAGARCAQGQGGLTVSLAPRDGSENPDSDAVANRALRAFRRGLRWREIPDSNHLICKSFGPVCRVPLNIFGQRQRDVAAMAAERRPVPILAAAAACW